MLTKPKRITLLPLLLCWKCPRNLNAWPCFMVEYLQFHICMDTLLSFKPRPARLDTLLCWKTPLTTHSVAVVLCWKAPTHSQYKHAFMLKNTFKICCMAVLLWLKAELNSLINRLICWKALLQYTVWLYFYVENLQLIYCMKDFMLKNDPTLQYTVWLRF